MQLGLFFASLLSLLIGNSCHAGYLHPQDGPHADLRVTIEDKLLRFSVGVNLAFLDESIRQPREALNEISHEESERLLNRFRQFLVDQATCEINGVRTEPSFERLEIFADPDPGMIAIFPKMGARALIRATAVMRFDVDSTIESAELTWPAYPLDQLAQEMEEDSAVQPRMYFEAVLTANGKTEPARFTHAEPTLRWSKSDAAEPDTMTGLPAPETMELDRKSVYVTVFLISCAVIILAYGIFRRSKQTWPRSALASTTLFVIAIIHHLLISPLLKNMPSPALTEEEAVLIQRTLHETMYRAFDYTSESDIYDRLEFALHGDLLGDMYEQIRLSLLQAEEEMKVGVVTGIQHIQTNPTHIDAASDTFHGIGFETNHQWRVDGTVYHWGHSHTRAHIYEANYRVIFTPDGWRISEHELISQRRIDPLDGSSIQEKDTIQEQLEELGYPDI